MMNKKNLRGLCHRTLGMAVLCGCLMAAWPVAWGYMEAPSLAERVASGDLPPVDERLPDPPLVMQAMPDRKLGKYGGELVTLMGRAKDVRLMVVYGYARLVGYDRSFEIVPDILERMEVEDNRIFTLHLRKGHRWSDGHPFTSEDFRYFWEDIANNEELSPIGVPQALTVDGKPARFEVIDETTVRYSWDNAHPHFMPLLAGTRPLQIFAPAHYLQQFHARYADLDQLAKMVEDAKQRSWSALHHRKNNPYKNDNPDAPSLQPWVNTTAAPSQRFVFKRNPYFHRVDANGAQLPYINRVVLDIADAKLIPAKTGAGESDLQARSIGFADFTFLKEGEKRGGYAVRLWKTTKGAQVALFPNLSVSDPEWRKLMRDVRFRRALSLAINRAELNQVLFYGLATEGNNTVHSLSPLFRPEYKTKWTSFDLEQANALLDEIGLSKRNRQNLRLLPDGRPMTIVVETAGEDTAQTDVLELIHDEWLKIGVKLFTKPLQREVFRKRIFAGSTLMSVWGGLENGLATRDTSPRELAPTEQVQLQWPTWGQYFETKGALGEPPDLPEGEELARLNAEWEHTADPARREAIWHRMLEIHADQVFTIGLVAGVPQPVVVRNTLRNVPKEGVYNWEPGAHFGIYHPDTFWFDR